MRLHLFKFLKVWLSSQREGIALFKGSYVKFKSSLLYGGRIKIGRHFRVYGPMPLMKAGCFSQGKIYIGDGFVLVNSTKNNLVGVLKPSSIFAGNGSITIGNNVGMSGVSIYSDASIEIGDNVKIGANCFIYDTDFHSKDPIERITDSDQSKVGKAPITIEKDAFIGLNCIVLKGVTIGRGAIIGSGCVVSKNVGEAEICVSASNRILSNINNL